MIKDMGCATQASSCLSWGMSPRHQAEGWHCAAGGGVDLTDPLVGEVGDEDVSGVIDGDITGVLKTGPGGGSACADPFSVTTSGGASG